MKSKLDAIIAGGLITDFCQIDGARNLYQVGVTYQSPEGHAVTPSQLHAHSYAADYIRRGNAKLLAFITEKETNRLVLNVSIDGSPEEESGTHDGGPSHEVHSQ